MKKKLWIAAGILLLCLLYLSLFPIRWTIDRECEAYLIDTGNMGETGDAKSTDGAQKLTVKLKGKYSFYLFRSDSFSGAVEIEGFPETSHEAVLRFDHGVANLVYHHWERYELHSECFGIISANFGMKDFVIFKADASGAIDLGRNNFCAIVSEDRDVSDVEAFRQELLEQAQN